LIQIKGIGGLGYLGIQFAVKTGAFLDHDIIFL